ncbi:hypothetical protein ACQ4M3_20610 [Leptolyngbya sp. AN03gr2]|uniref:hypothetical protein n=1 Tax=Leptolyngbya sp. AN03gr2 TaxID=3423364 RepID=UPI003D31A64C
MLGLEKIFELNLKGTVFAATDQSKVREHIQQQLNSTIVETKPNLLITKAKSLLKDKRFELQSAPLAEIEFLTTKIQQGFQSYLQSLLPDETQVIPAPPAISKNLSANTAELLKRSFLDEQELVQIKLLNPRDELTELGLPELTTRVNPAVVKILEQVFEDIKRHNPNLIPAKSQKMQTVKTVGLRWFIRGLPIDLAIRKTLQFLALKQQGQ